MSRAIGQAVASGTLKEYREDDETMLGRGNGFNNKGAGIKRLVKEAVARNLVVTALGGERYQLATERGKIILPSASFAEAIHALTYGVRKPGTYGKPRP
jgi:hypothetical protein